MAATLRSCVLSLKPFSGYYACCPSCKKKVKEEFVEEGRSTKSYWCSKCGRSYSQISLNYILALTIANDSNDSSSCIEVISFGSFQLEKLLGSTAVQLHQFMIEHSVPVMVLHRALSLLFLGRNFDFEFVSSCTKSGNASDYKSSYKVVKIKPLPDHTPSVNIITIIQQLMNDSSTGPGIITNIPEPVMFSSQSLYSDVTLPCGEGPPLVLDSLSLDQATPTCNGSKDDVIITSSVCNLRKFCKDFQATKSGESFSDTLLSVNKEPLEGNGESELIREGEKEGEKEKKEEECLVVLNENDFEELLKDWTSLSSQHVSPLSSSGELSLTSEAAGGINETDLLLLESQLLCDISLTQIVDLPVLDKVSSSDPTAFNHIPDPTICTVPGPASCAFSDQIYTVSDPAICTTPAICTVPDPVIRTSSDPSFSGSSFSLISNDFSYSVPFHFTPSNNNTSSLNNHHVEPSPDLFNSLPKTSYTASSNKDTFVSTPFGETLRSTSSFESSTPVYSQRITLAKRKQLFHLPLTSNTGLTSSGVTPECATKFNKLSALESPDLC